MGFVSPVQPSPPLSACEVLLTYGGDYQTDASGDLMTVQDTPQNPAATIQRVMFMILTNPAIGNASPDDMFNPPYGAGCRATLGRTATLNNIDAIQRNILNGLANDGLIATNPPPTVVPSVQSDSLVVVTVKFFTITGQAVTLPDLLVTPNGLNFAQAA